MLNSTALEVAITVTFMFLVLSLVASAIREGIEGLLQTRAINLERAIREMIGDETGEKAARLYNHSMIASLYRGFYNQNDLGRSVWARIGRGFFGTMGRQTPNTEVGPGGSMPFRTRLPSYIPARNFALAVLDLALTPKPGAEGMAITTPDEADPLKAIRAGIVNLPGERLQQAVRVAIDDAQGDLQKTRANLEAWFDSAMDRTSGWYKKQTHAVLFWIGLALAVGMNVDTVRIAKSLYTNDAVREAIVAEAQTVAGRVNNSPADDAALLQSLGCPARPPVAAQPAAGTAEPVASCAQEKLENLGFQIGWSGWERIPFDSPDFPWGSIPGFLLTALALTLGAPFWFDLLNKFMVIRSTVKPHEKSGEEGSEDRPARGR